MECNTIIAHCSVHFTHDSLTGAAGAKKRLRITETMDKTCKHVYTCTHARYEHTRIYHRMSRHLPEEQGGEGLCVVQDDMRPAPAERCSHHLRVLLAEGEG